MVRNYLIHKTTLFVEQFYNQIDYYLLTAGEVVAFRFIEEVENAISKVSEFPFSNSRFASESNGLKHLELYKKTIKSFPFLIFYQIIEQTIIIRCMYMSQRNYEFLIDENLAS